MAEQFILPDATSKLIRNFRSAVKCSVTTVAHANVGWTAASLLQYQGMMGLNAAPAIVGRNGLPPHFYLEIAANTWVPNDSSTDLVRMLSRGKVPQVLKALDASSRDAWASGRNFEALNQELKKGNVSISIYHLDGAPVLQAHRDKVAGFPSK